MNDHGVPTEAWYCSNESIKGKFDAEFGVDVKWDIPLLEGYKYQFFKNYSWKPSSANGFFGLINLGMIIRIFKIPKSVIVIHGWNYFTHFFILILGKLLGHTICIRHDMPQSQEANKVGLKQKVKRFCLKYFLFKRICFFLYIGIENNLFYKDYYVKDRQLIFCPYCVDNNRFQTESMRLENSLHSIRNKLGIPQTDFIILFSAKYIEKKRPLDILKAYNSLSISNCWLIMVGEGGLRSEMETFILEKNVKNVILTGFVNQSIISEYYAISNLFVMCSSYGENWGLSVNEAMNFNLPVILSNLTGCYPDLVKNGINGYVFETGNIIELSSKIEQVLKLKKLSWSPTSKEIINNYSFDEVIKNIKYIL